MAITSPTKGCLEVNDEICRILGYTREELLRKTWAEMTHPDDLAADVAQFDRVMAKEIDGYTMDKRWIRKDGRVIDSTISVKCLRRDDGSVDYFVALLLDVTQRKRAEEALWAAGEQIRIVTDTMSACVARCSRDLRYLWVSKPYADWLHLDARPDRRPLDRRGDRPGGVRPATSLLLSGVIGPGGELRGGGELPQDRSSMGQREVYLHARRRASSRAGWPSSST